MNYDECMYSKKHLPFPDEYLFDVPEEEFISMKLTNKLVQQVQVISSPSEIRKRIVFLFFLVMHLNLLSYFIIFYHLLSSFIIFYHLLSTFITNHLPIIIVLD